MARVLLLLPTRTYRAHDFIEAAQRIGVEVVVASEEPSTLEKLQPERLLNLDFLDPRGAAEKVRAFHRGRPFDAVIPVDEETAVAAATIARAVGLPHNSPEAARAARQKHVMREMLRRASVRVPEFRVLSTEDDPEVAGGKIRYPTILKPVFLSASRGVIRANDRAEFVSAFERLRAILDEPETRRRGGELARLVLVEDYVPGREVALEGLLRSGELRTLALFDKPDPLEGPFFEETLFVTPSRLPAPVQAEITAVGQKAARALGLAEGAVHAEFRLHPGGEVFVLEVAGRSIGGLCSRTLRFGVGLSLEEILLRHALGEEVQELDRESSAAGVLMIPIPGPGTLRAVRGLERARAVPGIEDVIITARLDQKLVPLPEGSSYLGFIFARAGDPETVERALRQAHRRLELVVADGYLEG